MALYGGSAPQANHAVFRLGRSWYKMPARVLMAVICLLVSQCVAADAHAQTGKIADGSRVVQKSGQLMLHGGDRRFSHSDEVPLYRVVSADGPRLWLKSESGAVEGWVDADDVIPFEDAVAFFTARIANDPRDPFLYAAQRSSVMIRASSTLPCEILTRQSSSIPSALVLLPACQGVDCKEGLRSRLCRLRRADPSVARERRSLLEPRRVMVQRAQVRQSNRRLRPGDPARSKPWRFVLQPRPRLGAQERISQPPLPT